MVVLGLALTACGGGTDTPGTSSSPTNGDRSDATAEASAGDKEARLGCGTDCQNAGQIGGGMHPDLYAKLIRAIAIKSDTPVSMTEDDFLPVTITCNLPIPCNGYVMVNVESIAPRLPLPTTLNRSDIALDPGSTSTFEVQVQPEAAAHFRSHDATPVDVIVNVQPEPSCEQIPELAAQCTEILRGFEQSGEDGIDRFEKVEVSVTPPQ